MKQGIVMAMQTITPDLGIETADERRCKRPAITRTPVVDCDE
jgi:hypothetical protein